MVSSWAVAGRDQSTTELVASCGEGQGFMAHYCTYRSTAPHILTREEALRLPRPQIIGSTHFVRDINRILEYAKRVPHHYAEIVTYIPQFIQSTHAHTASLNEHSGFNRYFSPVWHWTPVSYDVN